jgi:MoaA/NifB/PqqE/SkfB family radical SAM enzyme
MLDTRIPLHWERSTDAAYWSARPGAPLPPELVACSAPGASDERTRQTCPRCGGSAVRVRSGALFADDGVLFLDTRFTVCARCDRVLLGPEDASELAGRRHALAAAPPEVLEPRQVGIGQQLSVPLLSPEAERTFLDGAAGPARFSATAGAVVRHGGALLDQGSLPEALFFHSLELPERLTLKLEPTTRCNFGCPFCYGRHLEQGSLSRDDFLAVLDRIPGLVAVELTGEGEPLVHRQIFSFLRECGDRGLWTHVTSNGSLLTERNVERLLDAGLSSLAVSLESLIPERFARFRPGGDIMQVRAALHTVERVRRRREGGFTTSLWVSLMRETLDEVEEITRFASEVGVDHAEFFQVLNPMASYSRFYPEWLRRNLMTPDEIRVRIADPATPICTRKALESAIDPYRGRSCDIFMHTLMVNWQGVVTPCCLLKAPDFPHLGDLVREPLREVWNRPRYRTFRFALQHGIVLASCRDCPDIASA